MLFDTAAEWHAALNDLPPALLLASVIFDWLGTATKRDSLKAAGFWALVAGVVGAAFAVASGLRAEGSIEHGETVHRVMEQHETWAIAVSVAFALLAAWRIWRKGVLGPQERPTYLVAATVGALGIIYVAHLGGTIVFRHAGGVPTPALQQALKERTQEHEHAPGEEPEQAAPADTAAAEADTGHTHPPGTPPHQHD
ncbi:MAG: DUF2231 domain-containing protein [Gemmatimonadetes bacterium]|nr:DUF2231 domain-containing protein [Gemmatimonadota bacterium]MBI3081905.1 DUF2231 domain-containing protein [Gemmatimonadota bacterium]